MKTLLTSNISTGEVTAGGNPWTPRNYVVGESLTLAFRLMEDVDGVAQEADITISSTKASLGELDERPTSGSWKLQIGAGVSGVNNTTAELNYDCSAEDLQSAINAIGAIVSAYGSASVRKEDGSWLVVFGTGAAEVALQVRENRLRPASMLRCSAYQIDEVWQHELRLTQAPVAFTDVASRILPPAPEITTIREGGTADGIPYDEIQQLFISPEFRGQYYLQTTLGARSAALSESDNTDTITSVLEGLLGTNTVVVTNTDLGTAQIRFTGALAGTDVGELSAVPLDPPPGDLTLTLKFNKAELVARLRAVEAVTLPLEVRIYHDLGDGTFEEHIVLRTLLTVERPVIWPELAELTEIDWTQPLSPTDYKPFVAGNMIFGQKAYPAVLGDGSATHFVLTHGLATQAVYVFVRENVDGGRQLVAGTDYTVTGMHTGSVTVNSLVGAPSSAAWAALVVSVQYTSAFAAGLSVTTSQVVGLDAQLALLAAAITELQALAPTTPLGITNSANTTVPVEISIDDYTEQFPQYQIKDDSGKVVKVRPGLLWAAVHDASVSNFSDTLPDVTSSAGQVNANTGDPILAPGGGASPSSICANGEFVASDGRRVYPVSQDGVSNSYFPRDFERELFMFEINAQMLRAGTMLSLSWKLELQLLQANTRMQAVVVLEHGAYTQESSPSPVGTNLQAITWNATPLLKQPLILGESKVTHSFGAQIIRAANGDVSANKLIYGFATAAGSTPAGADFALRARVINWDTENAIADARGIISMSLSEGSATIA